VINASVIESAIYKIIAKGIPAIPKRMSEIRVEATTKYLKMFLENEKSLNFKATKGSSAINKYDMTSPRATRTVGLDNRFPKKGDFSERKGRVLMNKAFAGVGTPMNLSDCRRSMLNLASLRAENIPIRKAEYGR
jgi:hypothetical protein